MAAVVFPPNPGVGDTFFSNGILFSWTGDQWISSVTDTNFNGVIGATGPEGLVGSTGPQGVKGDIGNTGPQGGKGDTGNAGPTGPQGATGNTGSQGPGGAKGNPGSAGPTGPKGNTGSAGPTGPKGNTGSRGPTGPGGAKGNPGPTGPGGARGPAGPTGPAGAKGNPGPTGPIATGGPAGPLVTSPDSTVGRLRDKGSYIEFLAGGRFVGVNYFVSDERYKENIGITSITKQESANLINSIVHKQFYWNNLNPADIAGQHVDIGYTTQNLHSISSKFTNTMSDGKMIVDTNNLITHMTHAIQYLMDKIDELEAEIQSL